MLSLGDGRILAASERGFNYVIHNLSTNGGVSAEPFLVLTNTARYGTSFAVAGDQKVVVIKGRDPNILRFRRDGVSGLAIEPDGSVLVFGPFQSFDGVKQTGLVRLLGSLDFVCWAAPEPEGIAINVAGPRNRRFILQRRLGIAGPWTDLLEGAIGATGHFVHRVPMESRMSWFRVRAVE